MTKEEILKIPKVPGIYLLKNTINNKCYIGQSINLRKRLSNHINNSTNVKFIGNHLYSAMNKYGIENFKVVLLEIINPLEYEEPISDILNNGYNKTKGGESILGCNHSEETRKKISIALKKYFETHKWILNGTIYTYKQTYGLNYKEHYFVESFSRAELSRILIAKGYNITVSSICRVINGKQGYSYDFVFGNTKEECLEKIKFFESDKAKHSTALAPNYLEYLEYLKTIVDVNGYLPTISEIAKHYNRKNTTIIGWNKHISEYIELDKYYNRLKLKGYSNSNIKYDLEKNRCHYKIIDTVDNKTYIFNSREASEFFKISQKSFVEMVKIKEKTKKLYKKKYLVYKITNE